MKEAAQDAGRPGPWSSAVLAGGFSSRFDGPKLLSKVGGKTLVRRVAEAVFPESGDLRVVVGQDADRAMTDAIASEIGDLGPRVVRDTPGRRTPAAGIEAALSAAVFENVLVVAVDLPFLSKGFVRFLVERSAGRAAAVPFYRGFFEPTCAVYSTRLLPVISEYRLRLPGPLSKCFEAPGLSVAKVSEEEILRFGEPGVLFFNVNTRDDLVKAESIFLSFAPDVSRRTERGVSG